MNELKTGVILSYINIFLTNVIGIVLTPFIVKSLGTSEYGLYTLIGSIVGYITVMDLGLNNTIVRYISRYRTIKDKEGEQRFLGAIFIIYGIISLIVVLIGIVFYLNIDVIFSNSLNELEIAKAKLMSIVLIFNLAITLPGGAFTAVANAYEKFIFIKALANIKYLFRAVLVFLLLTYSKDSLDLIILDTILNILIILVTYIYVSKKLKFKIIFHIPKINFFYEIFTYSIWIFIFAIAYNLQWLSGQSVLGVTTNTKTVAIYGIGIMLGGYYGSFAAAINTLLLPRATKISVENNNSKLFTDEIIKFGRINVIILLYILCGFIILGKKFIKLWVGESYQEAWYISVFIMVAMTLPLVQAFGNSILEAKKKNRFKAILSLITLGLASILGFYFSKEYGLLGMIIPITLSVFINGIIMSFYFKKIFNFNIKLFFKKVFLKPILVNIVLVSVLLFMEQYYSNITWISFVISSSVFTILYILLNFIFVFNKTEKQLINNFLNKIYKR